MSDNPEPKVKKQQLISDHYSLRFHKTVNKLISDGWQVVAGTIAYSCLEIAKDTNTSGIIGFYSCVMEKPIEAPKDNNKREIELE